MYKRTLLLSILIILLTNCTSEKDNITGNWYRYIEPIDSIHSDDYEELYFSSDTIYMYNLFSGYQGPMKYIIKNDSLINLKFNKVFLINEVTKSSFKYTTQTGEQYILKRQTQHPTLEESIRNKSVTKDYSQEFLNRYYQQKSN